MKHGKFLIYIMFSLIIRAIFAQGGPPMLTDDAVPVEKGKWEINNAIIISHNEFENILEMPHEDINYGLSKKIQLKYETSIILKKTEGTAVIGGLGRSNFGVKWQFYKNTQSKISISVYPQLTFNTTSVSAEREITDKGLEFLLPFSFMKEFANNSIVAEVGRVFESKSPGGWIYGLLFNKSVSDKFSFAAEIFGTSNYGFSENETFLNLGIRYGLSDNAILLLSAGDNFIVHNNNPNTFLSYLGIQFVL